MATTFPSGADPYTFSGSLPAGGTDTSSAPIDAQQTETFTTTAPAGAMFVTFVVFDYPNANNSGAAPPQVPIVEILTRPPSGGADPWQLLQSTAISGDRSISLNADQVSPPFVDYTFTALAAPGVYQIQFLQNGATAFDGLSWTLRFTINDGLTTASNQVGLTFVLDTANTQAAWLATPGQLALPPAPLDMAAALSGLTLAGQTPSVSPQRLLAGRPYSLSVPIGNYGPGPLTLSAITAPASPNGFTLTLAGPVTIPPGSQTVVTAGFTSPAGGQTGAPAGAATFALTTNDPLAAVAGPHFSGVGLYATAGNIEIVLVLDLSGSMATDDAGGQSRWFQVQQTVGAIATTLTSFAGASDLCSEVVYPAASGASEGQVVVAQAPIDANLGGKISTPLGAMAPVDSTPMAGTPAAPGGIYTAMGLPTNPATDCGLFLPSVNAGFGRNYRRLVLMSDGVSNIGDDPKSIPASYYLSRNVQATTIAYGKPGGGQVDPATLQAIATNSTPPGATANFIAADQTGVSSVQLAMSFEKALAKALGLNFAVDPDATLAPGAVNQHAVIITQNDTRAGFFVTTPTPAVARLLQVQLLTPLGETVTPASAASFGLTYQETALTKAYYAAPIALNDLKGKRRYGTWTIVVSEGQLAAPVTGAQPQDVAIPSLPYAYMASVESALTLAVGSTSPVIHAGDTIEIVAALAEHGRPLLDAHVTAQVVPTGQGFETWLAAQVVTEQEFIEARRALGGLQDVQALFIKTQALAAKGIFFPGPGGPAAQPMTLQTRTGTYRGSFTATQQPGSYAFLVVATGTDGQGSPFTRHQTWTSVVTPLPDAASTLVSITYQLVGAQMQATLRVWPQDRFGNVILVDPAISQAIQVLLAGGAVASGPLTWNLDASYSQNFTFPASTTPSVGVTVNGVAVLPPAPLPVFARVTFVNEALQYVEGRQATPTSNAYTDPAKALGDPSQKPLSAMLSLGAGGLASFAVKGPPLRPQSAIVFVAPDTDLRAYAVDVLPAQAGVGWVEIGRSRGVTAAFGLVANPPPRLDTKGWEIEVSGRIAGESFDVKIPLTGRLRPPVDPIARLGGKGILSIRIRDLSNEVDNPDGTPSASPGVSLLGIGFEL